MSKPRVVELAYTGDLKSPEVNPHEGSSPSSGTIYRTIIGFLLRNGLKLSITQVPPGEEGICGHPVAVDKFLEYLKANGSNYHE